jgi:hypothetical protein
LPPTLQLSCFLRYLRSGSFHRCIGTNKYTQMSQSAVCRIVNKVNIKSN